MDRHEEAGLRVAQVQVFRHEGQHDEQGREDPVGGAVAESDHPHALLAAHTLDRPSFRHVALLRP